MKSKWIKIIAIVVLAQIAWSTYFWTLDQAFPGPEDSKRMSGFRAAHYMEVPILSAAGAIYLFLFGFPKKDDQSS
jgi:hypothetical protein